MVQPPTSRLARIAQLEAELALLRAAEGLPPLPPDASQPEPVLGKAEPVRITLAHLLRVSQDFADFYFVLGLDGTYLEAVAMDDSRLMKPSAELMGRKLQDILPPKVAQEYLQAIQTAIGMPGLSVPLTYSLVPPDGMVHDYNARLSALDEERVLVAVFDITAQRTQERLLAQQELMLTRTQEVAQLGYWYVEADTQLLVNSPQVQQMLGVPARMLREDLNRVLPTLVHPNDWQSIVSVVTPPATGYREDDLRFRQPDGSYRWMQFRVHTRTGDLPAGIEQYGMVQDIHEQKLRERELRDSRARLKAILDNTVDVVAIIDADGRNLFTSNSLLAVAGYDPDTVRGAHFKRFVHPQDFGRVQAALNLVLAQPGRTASVSYRFQHQDGYWLHFETVGTNLLHEPAIGGVLLVSRDISSRLAAENALAASRAELEFTNRRTQEILNNTTDVIGILDRNGSMLWNSQSATQVTAYPLEAFAMRSTLDFVHPDDQHLIHQAMRDLLDNPSHSVHVQYRFRHADGHWLYMDSIATNLLSNPAVQGILVVSREVSEQRRQMAAVEESRALFRGLFESAADGLFLISGDGSEVLDCNPRALELFEAPSVAALLANNLQAIRQAARTNARGLLQLYIQVRKHQSARAQLMLISLQGRRFWGNVAINRVPLADKAFYIARLTDVTEVMMAHEALQQAERRYRSIFENSVEGIFQCTVEGRFLVANPPLVRMLGYTSAEQLLRPTVQAHQFYADVEDRKRLIDTLMRDGFVTDFVYQLLRADGTVRWVSENTRLVRDETGHILYLEGALVDIHERKLAEDAMRAAERLYRDIFQNAAEGIFQTTLEGELITANPPFAAMLGYDDVADLRSAIGNQMARLYFEPQERSELLAILQLQPIYSREVRLIRKDGAVIWVLGSMRKVLQEDGSAAHIEGSIVDITDRKLAEAELLEREARLQALMQGLPVIVYKLDLEGRVILAEGRGLTSQGWQAEQLLGKSIGELYTDEQYLQYIRRGLAGEESLQWHTERNGLFYETRTTVLRGVDGRVKELIAVEIDVTQRVWAEQLLRASESRFRSLAENAPDFIIIADAESWEVIYINRMEFLGWRSDTLTKGNRVLQHMQPDDQTYLLDNRRRLLKGAPGSFITTLVRYQNARGDWEWLQIRETILSFRENGRSRELLATVTIVTDQIRTQEALRQSESLYRTIIRHFPNGLILLYDDKQQNLVAGGQLLPEMGIDPAALIGKPVQELLPVSFDPTPDPSAIRVSEVMLRDRLHRVYTVPVTNASGQQYAGLLMSQDITEQKLAEQQLRNSVREKEVLLQEIYHRVKNNLQVVSSLLEIQSDSVTDETTLRLLRESQARIYSIALVHEKLYQSRDLHNIDFRDYVSNLAEYIGQAFGSSSSAIQLVLDVDTLPINLDIAMRCGLVLNELISNAMKYAFPDGRNGRIVITARTENDYLTLLSVSDNGVGLPSGQDLQRRDSLGLRLVSMIARQLRAQVDVTSGPDGTTFALHFAPEAAGSQTSM